MTEQPAAPEPQVLSREVMLAELLAWGKEFIKRSEDWRRNSWEEKWQEWQRNSLSIFDPALAKKKEPWQSTAFWPITASHRENALSQLFKTEVGPRPPIDVKARNGIVNPEIPGADQSENIRDLVLRERERAKYEIGRNGVLDDKTTYGSGFAQIFYETVVEDRVVQQPVYEDVQAPWKDNGASITRAVQGKPQLVGYKPVVQPQVIFRGVRFRPISIWDVFPDPQALAISKHHPIGVRYPITYGEIVDGAKPTVTGQAGYVLPEAVEKLKFQPSQETTPADKQTMQTDRHIAEGKIERTPYAHILRCYRIQAMLPKKWVLINKEPIDDPEALMPAEVRFHDLCVISVQPNDSYDGEPDLVKDDYMPVNGQFYGMGVPEMLKDVQSVTNESINQRLDSGTVSLLNVYAVIQKAVVDPKDFSMGPGSVLRFKAQDGITNGVDGLFKKVEMGGLDKGSFVEPQEWERAGEQRTSVTATTLGTEDNTDTTLGAQKIQQGVTGTKIAYLGMLSEFGAQREYFRRFWALIYANYQPQDYVMALGPERAASVIPMTPEQIENSYQYYPLGIFELETKGQKQAQLAAWHQQFGMFPWANVVENAREQARNMDVEPEKLILPEAEAIQIMVKADQMAQQKAEQIIHERDQVDLAKKADEGAKLKAREDKK